jgi:hypothetical protein
MDTLMRSSEVNHRKLWANYNNQVATKTNQNDLNPDYHGGKLMASMLGASNSGLIMRLKPWEAYKAQENESKGLLAALN